jgi:bacterioferritin (cytochrome b1)
MRTVSAPPGDCLRRLLQGEISAIEAYSRALAKVRSRSGASDLRRMMQDHSTIAKRLEERILALGLAPGGDEGDSDWARLAVEAARSHGEHDLLETLVLGEQAGIEEYKDALDDESLDNASKQVIRSAVLPRHREHVSTLKKYLH